MKNIHKNAIVTLGAVVATLAVCSVKAQSFPEKISVKEVVVVVSDYDTANFKIIASGKFFLGKSIKTKKNYYFVVLENDMGVRQVYTGVKKEMLLPVDEEDIHKNDLGIRFPLDTKFVYLKENGEVTARSQYGYTKWIKSRRMGLL